MAPAHAMPLAMGDARALDAIARIERALARIEASARTSAAHPPIWPIMPNFPRCATRISALRARVEGAIGQIDRLLESEGPDGDDRHRGGRPALQCRLP